MKTIIGSKNEIICQIQAYVDALPKDAAIAVAYNEDTAMINLLGKKLIQVMEAGNIISSALHFDITTEDYNGEEIDLALLGIGYKAQIGFNEVATPYASTKHTQKLTRTTKEEYSFLGDVPDEGITLGISDIVKAKKIIVLATGNKKAEAAYNMLYARDDSTVPAAFLQLPPNVDVYLDEEAASLL